MAQRVAEHPAVAWLLSSPHATVRLGVVRDVLGEDPGSARVGLERDALAGDPWLVDLLGDHGLAAWSRVSAYKKWNGAHWRLVSLAELGCPPQLAGVDAMCDRVLEWLTRPRQGSRPVVVDGRERRCASQEGNAVGACVLLGRADDARVARLVDELVTAQWPDGGWNCDLRPQATHSSFHETLRTAWGLRRYAEHSGRPDVLGAARRAEELLLRHRVVHSERTGEVVDRSWLRLRWPAYWHYGLLPALAVLAAAGVVGDPRAAGAVQVLADRCGDDGRWPVDGAYWRAAGPDARGTGTEVVDWGRRGPSELVTLVALRVLRAAGRLG